MLRRLFGHASAVGFFGAALLQGMALAAMPGKVPVDIPAQGLSGALIQLGRQTGVEIAFTPDIVASETAPALHGEFTPEEALQRLIAGAGLKARQTKDGVWLLEALPPPQATAEAEPLIPSADYIEEIAVTGTRVRRNGMSSPTPVTVLSMEELRRAAPTTLIASLDQLPQFVGNQTPATVNTWTGNSQSSILNLRGVGGNRTLTLINGRRVVASSRLGASDINTFPEMMVERVEIVTGGASAVYGSDAVAGVVNFILDTGFTGVKADAVAGISSRGDTENGKLSVLAGTDFGPGGDDRGHILVAADYFHSEPLKSYADRAWFQDDGLLINPDPAGPTWIHARNIRSRRYTDGGLFLTGPFAYTEIREGGTPVPFAVGDPASFTAQVGGSGVNLTSRYWPTTENTRASLFAYAEYQLSDDITAYLQGIYGHSNARRPKGPNLMYGPWAAHIYADNAFLPEDLRKQMLDAGVSSVVFGRAGSRDLGGAMADMDNNTQVITAGLKGTAAGWRYDGYYQYGINRQRISLRDTVRIDRLYRALDAVADGSTGTIVCRSTLTHPDDGCVPANLFGPDAASAEARAYILDDLRLRQDVVQHFAEMTMDREVLDTRAGPVSLALGFSWRRDELDQRGDPADTGTGQSDCLTASEADTLGYRGLPGAYGNCNSRFERATVANISGQFDVTEVFAETFIPLAQNASWADEMSLTLAARYADYSGSGGVWAWKAGVIWAPVADLRLRSTLSRDTRAGTLAERFNTATEGDPIDDPLLPGRAPYAVTTVLSGNPEVEPERADTYVIGAVYSPGWAPGFALSLDFFDIRIKDAIGELNTQDIVEGCYLEDIQAYCNRITRASDDGPGPGQIATIQNSYVNMDKARSRGLDIEVLYQSPVRIFGGDENIGIRGIASHIIESSTTSDGTYLDAAGQTGVSIGRPRWQGILHVNYTRGPLSLSIQERAVSSGEYDATWQTGIDIDDNHVAGALYTTVDISYHFAAAGGDVRAFLNIANVFDKTPPRAPNYNNFFGSTYTNKGLFDEIGRRFTVGLSLTY